MSWPEVTLDNICSLLSGNAWSASKFKDEGIIPIIRIQNLGNNVNEKFIWWNESYDDRFVVTKGDILLSLSGSIKIDIWNGEPALLNQRIVKMTPTEGVDNRWFYWQINSIILEIEKMGKWALVNNVSITDLKLIKIPLPPLETQKRIADILDAADALRQKDQELLKKYDELAQAIFIDMFGNPVKNEKGWEVLLLKEICEKITDGTHFSPPNVVDGIPYITAKHLKKDYIDFKKNPTFISLEDHQEIYKRCKPEKGDVLYIKDGATTGIAAVNEFDFEFSMLSSLALIKPNLDQINSYYLSCYLNNQIVKEQLIREYMAGAAIKRFTLDKIKKFKIVVPPVDLQSQFEKKWKQIRLLLENLKKSKAEDIFQNLLQKAFNGELVEK